MGKQKVKSLIPMSLLRPIPDRWIKSSQLRLLYEEAFLTQEEFILLDYFEKLNYIKSGETVVSFQGLKRAVDLHQARLTKALKRLVTKGYLEKKN